MKKNKYTKPEIEVIVFENEDVIIASGIILPEDPLSLEYTSLFGE